MTLVLVYDGGCPFCCHFAQRAELVGGLPELDIRDGRADQYLRQQLSARGLELAKGAVLLEGDRAWHGADAIAELCRRLQPSDGLLQLLRGLFMATPRARRLYPVLLWARRLALQIKGLAEDPDQVGPGNFYGLPMAKPSLTLLFDGACPLCRREVEALRARDQGQGRLGFVDIDAPDYDPAAHGGISYREAMGRIHAIAADGRVIVDVAAFREAYRLVGLGWLYAPTTWPVLKPSVDALYSLWAQWRLKLTGRADLPTLCAQRQGR